MNRSRGRWEKSPTKRYASGGPMRLGCASEPTKPSKLIVNPGTCSCSDTMCLKRGKGFDVRYPVAREGVCTLCNREVPKNRQRYPIIRLVTA